MNRNVNVNSQRETEREKRPLSGTCQQLEQQQSTNSLTAGRVKLQIFLKKITQSQSQLNESRIVNAENWQAAVAGR